MKDCLSFLLNIWPSYVSRRSPKIITDITVTCFSEYNEVKHRIWAPPQSKTFLCFWALSILKIICVPLPTSKRNDIHEVNCYSNWCTLRKMTIATFNSRHAFHNYAPHESVVSAHSDHITFGHNWVLPADTHDPTTPCYHTDAPRHLFDRISRWLLLCTCTASNFLIREVYESSWSERSHEFY